MFYLVNSGNRCVLLKKTKQRNIISKMSSFLLPKETCNLDTELIGISLEILLRKLNMNIRMAAICTFKEKLSFKDVNYF